MAIVWTKDLAIGVDQIDEQHRELFRRFDDLQEACARWQGREQVGALLVFLEEYVHFHFQAEEELMARYDYPELEEHRAMHAGFRRHQQAIKEEFQNEEATGALLARTNKMLLAWIIDHIQQVDVRIGIFIRRKIQGGDSGRQTRSLELEG